MNYHTRKSHVTWTLLPFSVGLALAMTGCEKEKLAGVICTPGEFACTEDGAQLCSEDGTTWIAAPCDEGWICIEGTCDDPLICPDECREQKCQPGATVCADNHLYVMQCDETGTEMCYSHSCVDPPMDGVCYDGECVSICTAGQKSYLGCEYFAVDLDNHAGPYCDYDDFGEPIPCSAADAQYAIVVSNPNPDEMAYVMISKGQIDVPEVAEGTCEAPELPPEYVDAAVLPPKGVKIFELDPLNINGTEQAFKSYRVASNIPLTAYQFNPLENVNVYSNDASLLLPTTTAGTDFLVMAREQTWSDFGAGFVTVVGIDDEPTTVAIRTTTPTMAGEGIPSVQPGEEITVTLEKYEIFNLESSFIGGDFTGSRVRSNKPVLVYAGSECANTPNTTRCDLTTFTCEQDPSIACGCTEADGPNCSPHEPCASQNLTTCCCDHLEQQMFPVSTWDSNYVAARSYPRGGESDVWRILASQDGTQVTLSPDVAVVPELDEGEWFEFEAAIDFLVDSNKPILLGQYLAAEHAPNPGIQDNDAGIGDPAFMLSVPARQFRDSYVFVVPNKYALDYVSIAMKVGSEARLDGVKVEEVPAVRMDSIHDGEWVAVRAPVADGYHTLVCSEPCSVMVHGYDSYVSYGYPGGLNLMDDSEGK